MSWSLYWRTPFTSPMHRRVNRNREQNTTHPRDSRIADNLSTLKFLIRIRQSKTKKTVFEYWYTQWRAWINLVRLTSERRIPKIMRQLWVYYGRNSYYLLLMSKFWSVFNSFFRRHCIVHECVRVQTFVMFTRHLPRSLTFFLLYVTATVGIKCQSFYSVVICRWMGEKDWTWD